MVKQSRNHDWLEQVQEEALEPDLPICDPHHHLWRDRKGAVQPCYMLDEIVEDLSGGHNIVSTVFIECGAEFREDGPEDLRCVGETDFVVGIAEQADAQGYGHFHIAKGIVGTADLKIGDAVADVLDAQIEAGKGRFRGIRLGTLWHESPEIADHRTNPPKGLMLRDDFREGFRHLASRELSFEVWCCHPQIDEAADLARAFPDTVIVLDHFGGPVGIGPYEGKSEEVFAHWRKMIDGLAACPNVYAKLGGLNMEVNGFGWHERDKPPTSDELLAATRHYFDYQIEKFGVERCMFESNFPVDKVSCSYTVVWNMFKKLARDFSADEKAALFHDTATGVYRL
ncbi:MAG: amidohydrolase family protein [Pseudomonadota bacterium]